MSTSYWVSDESVFDENVLKYGEEFSSEERAIERTTPSYKYIYKVTVEKWRVETQKKVIKDGTA